MLLEIFLSFLSQNLQLVLNMLALVIALIVFLYVSSSHIFNKNRFSVSIKDRESAYDSEVKTRNEKLILFLSKMGVNYHMRRIVKPSEYRGVKFIFGLGFSVLMILAAHRLSPFLVVLMTVAAFLFGYFLPDLWFWGNNLDDNKKLLKDIKRVYDTLRIRLKVNVFIVDALEECYLGVESARLKKAIYELTEGLKNNSEASFEIESFRTKFDNPHIDQLANAMTQYYKTGNADAMMGDLSEQMLAIDHAMNMRTKEKLETVSLILEVLVLIGMIGGIMVALFFSLGGMIDTLM